MKTREFELSIVIPVFNSASNLMKLVTTLHETLKEGPNYQIILVNDGSRDGSWRILSKVAQEDPHVTAINLRRNFGQDNAIMAGFHLAKGRFVVVMDDDLQHEPKDILGLLNKIKSSQADIVYGHYSELKAQRWKVLGSWFNGMTAQYLLGKPEEIYLSPFKIFRGDLLSQILDYSGPYPYVDGILLRLTRNTEKLHLQHRERDSGESNYNLIRSIRVWLRVATNFSVIPLRVVGVMGGIATAFGLLLALYFIWEYFYLHSTVQGWTSLVVLLLCIGGFLMIGLAVVGEYVGRLFMLANRMPQFSIESIVQTQKDQNVTEKPSEGFHA